MVFPPKRSSTPRTSPAPTTSTPATGACPTTSAATERSSSTAPDSSTSAPVSVTSSSIRPSPSVRGSWRFAAFIRISRRLRPDPSRPRFRSQLPFHLQFRPFQSLHHLPQLFLFLNPDPDLFLNPDLDLFRYPAPDLFLSQGPDQFLYLDLIMDQAEIAVVALMFPWSSHSSPRRTCPAAASITTEASVSGSRTARRKPELSSASGPTCAPCSTGMCRALHRSLDP